MLLARIFVASIFLATIAKGEGIPNKEMSNKSTAVKWAGLQTSVMHDLVVPGRTLREYLR